MNEIWQPIAGFEEYEVSSAGRVRRAVESSKGNLPKILRPWVTREGYAIVTLFANRKPKRKQISRLVCEAFHGPPPTNLHQAAHGDGDPGNNSEDNLRWATRSENMADCLIHGTRPTGAKHGRTTKPERTPRGEKHGHAKLSEESVRAIIAHPMTIGSGVRLAKQYRVSPAAICLIRKRKIWRHL